MSQPSRPAILTVARRMKRLETPASQVQSNSWSQGEKALKFPVQLIHGDADIRPGPHTEATRVKEGSLEKVTQCDSTRFTGSTQRVLEGGWNDRLIGKKRRTAAIGALIIRMPESL